MQVILKPVSHPQLGEIIIRDNLFAVGRHEEPFAGYDPQVVAKLSRRHARIFEQDGGVYVTDLGSLNGTSVNGDNVAATPVPLKRDDRICFTDLCYQIDILGSASRQTAAEAEAPPVQVVLVPEKQKLTLEPIVITRFPFLVNKSSDVFSRYRDLLPEEVSYISRRHAHLFLKGQELFIEDLGSTNGTFVGGQRLDEHARQLHNGEVVAFGGDNFVYRVQLLYAGQEPSDKAQRDASKLLTATAAAGGEDVTRTTFVTSANSFLDIYCIEEDDAAGDSGKGEQVDAALAGKRGHGRWRRLLGRPMALLREIRGDVADEKPAATRKYWLAAALVAAGVALWAYLDTAPRRELRGLVDSGDYVAALAQANRLLADHPQDREIGELATESLLKAVVPEWQSALEAGDFPNAQRELERATRLATDNAEGRQLLELMRWITRMEQFIAQRGGVQAPLVMFQDEDTLRELVAWWDSDTRSHRRALGSIAQQVPAFEAMRGRVFSHVRSLESQRALALAAVERLQAAVEQSLDAGSVGEVQVLLTDFASRYPRIEGVDQLRDDLQKYQSIDAEVRAGEWIAARRRVAETAFETPLFRQQVRALTKRSLPSTDVVRRYYQAADDWRNGDAEKAIAALEKLEDERWGEVAQRRLQHYRKVLDDYRRLQASRQDPDYEPALLAFFRQLDPQRDEYYIDAMQEEFRVHSDKALEQAQQDLAAARSAWEDYEETGGIRALHRLEGEISAVYRKLAQLLGDAYRDSARGLGVYTLLDQPYADEWRRLHARIVNEIRLQRQSLLELAMVLEPSLKQAKLDLLPVLQADDS